MKRLMKRLSDVQLKELDEADIKMDRCPMCKSEPLERIDGFKFCKSCNNAYKIFDGKAYLVNKENN
ncbi:hypothetical protein D3C81_1447170 [compost metagenome]